MVGPIRPLSSFLTYHNQPIVIAVNRGCREQFEVHRSGAELVRHGLHVGLTPRATQFLAIGPTSLA